MTAHTTHRSKTFQADQSGSVAIMFALTLSALIMIIGAAIDIGRALHSSNKLAAALDSAALAAGKALRTTKMTDAELQDLARRFFDANMVGNAGNYTVVDGFNAQIDRANTTVKVDIKAWIPTTFTRIAGFQKIDLPKTVVVSYDTKDIEVGLQLDVTGSMGWNDDKGVQKLASLKVAVSELLDILLPDAGTPNKVRVGLAPFAAGVNAGDFAATVSNGTSTNGCVYERLRAASDLTDYQPTGLDAFKVKADLTTLPGGGGIQNCPSNAKVMELTTDKASLKTSVSGYSAGGSTAGQLGTAWAWGLVSPNWSSIWSASATPAAYADKKTAKYVILMTDGIYNTFNGQCEKTSCDSNHPIALQSSKQARDLCDKIRADKITIYSIGFIVKGDDPAAADTLKYCAGNISNFFLAEDGAQLSLAFRSIAENISRLHLTQ